MVGTFLSEPVRAAAEILLIGSALFSSFIAWRVWKHSKKKDDILEAEKLAKQIDLDKTNQEVMDNQLCIKSLDSQKASKGFVEDKLKVVFHRIKDVDNSNKDNFNLLLEEIRESKRDIKTILGAIKMP